jgi:hypothetical protein
MAVTKAAPPNGNGKAPTAPVDVTSRGIGRTGLREWSGRIDEEFLKELKYERKYQVYKEMSENDPIVGAVLRSFEYLIRGVDFRFEAKDQNDPAQQELAQQLQLRLTTMQRPWPELLSEILSFLAYGWSLHEILYEARPDGIYWADWPIRAQETLFKWEFVKTADGKDTDAVEAMTQIIPTDSSRRTVPLSKSLLFRLGAHKGNPEGRSILRNAYLPWYYKNHLQRIEAIGVERDLAGYPVLYVPGEVLDDVSGNAYVAAQKIVTNIKRDEQEGALLSSSRDAAGNLLWELKLLSTGGTRSFDTNSIIDRYDQRIAMTCLADFIMIGHEKVGSFALHSSKTEVFLMSLVAVLDAICGTINRNAVPQLAELNGWPIEDLPQLVHGDIEIPDLKELGDYITALSGAGVPLFPDFKLENRLREMGGLPQVSQEEFDQREAAAAADAQAKQDAQMAVLQQDLKDTKTQAADAGAKADAATQKAMEKREGSQPIVVEPHVTIHQAPTTVTAPAPGAQTFNLPAPTIKSEVVLAQPVHVDVQPAAPATVSVPVTVEAATAPDVRVETPVTVQASAPVVVPAPAVTVEAPVLVQPAPVTVNVAAPDAPVVKVDAPVTVDTIAVASAIQDQTAAQRGMWERAITALTAVFKRPKKLTITNPDGTTTEARPED